MEPLEIVGIVICTMGVTLYVVTVFLERQIAKEQHAKRLRAQRAIQAQLFCDNMFYRFGPDVYHSLTDFNTMVFDNKELTAANYINIDKLVNLN